MPTAGLSAARRPSDGGEASLRHVPAESPESGESREAGLGPRPARSAERERRAIAGDREALERFWEDNRRWVAAVLLAHMRRGADLDDLMQQVALSLVSRHGQVKAPGLLRPWLRTVAVNAAREDARKHTNARKRLRLVGPGSTAGRGNTPIGGSDDPQEQGKALLRAARDLPESYREPLLLRAAHGLSYREISAITGLKETTVETRIARGRRMLRELARRTQDLRPTPDQG